MTILLSILIGFAVGFVVGVMVDHEYTNLNGCDNCTQIITTLDGVKHRCWKA